MHNQIGIGNDALENLYSGLLKAEMPEVVFANFEKNIWVSAYWLCWQRKFKLFFHTCFLIFSSLGVARFLTESEIDMLEQNVMNLSQLIFLKFKGKNITLKMHDILGNYTNIL